MTPSAPQIRVQDIDHCGIVAGIIENVPRGWGMGRRGDKGTPRRSEGMKEGRYEGIYSYSLAPTLPRSPLLPLYSWCSWCFFPSP
ncbi:hypothetical protein ACF3DV_08465 [Chlorogloeopsis fritschii PCC 9212]|uniref:hypothetical protein n=1 Tax=Chlorogloeopsis fritschii TaxID=1124 RepID=UPI001F1D4E1E|nr:hypothetical protein [Chlorogloeopsis fritschii]